MGSHLRPKGRRVVNAAIALCLALVLSPSLPSCSDDSDPNDDAKCQSMSSNPANAEAFEWLKAPVPRPNRLEGLSNEASLALAYELQSRGVLKVVAALSTDPATTPWVDARGLVVQLPADPKNRMAVFNLYAKQVRLYGFTPRADTGQKFLFIPAYRASGGAPD